MLIKALRSVAKTRFRFPLAIRPEVKSRRAAGRVVVTLIFSLASLGHGISQTGGPSTPAQPVIGKPAPGFTVETLDGGGVSLADYRGKAVLVNFWATWCGNCKLEMPWLAELREQYASQGFEVLGILTDNASSEKIAALTQKYGVHYPILMCNHKTAQAYGGLPDLPESFFIDREGRVVAVISGADSKAEIEAGIRKALHKEKNRDHAEQAAPEPLLHAWPSTGNPCVCRDGHAFVSDARLCPAWSAEGCSDPDGPGQ